MYNESRVVNHSIGPPKSSSREDLPDVNRGAASRAERGSSPEEWDDCPPKNDSSSLVICMLTPDFSFFKTGDLLPPLPPPPQGAVAVPRLLLSFFRLGLAVVVAGS